MKPSLRTATHFAPAYPAARVVTRLAHVTLVIALIFAATLPSSAGDPRAPQVGGRVNPGGEPHPRTPSATDGQRAAKTPPATKPAALASYGNLPLSFEANGGQANPDVKFLSRGPGYSLFLTSTDAVLSLRQPAASAVENRDSRTKLGQNRESDGGKTAVVRIRLVGAGPAPAIEGIDKLPGVSNYFIGNDPGKWRTNVPNYGRVKYRGIYPGVDVVYYGNQRELEYNFIVAPGSDPRVIRLRPEGVQKAVIDTGGDLVLQTGGGDLRLRKPTVYQEVEGVRRSIAARYVLRGKREIGFQVGVYDSSRPLVIDPVLSYSTYLGGSSRDVALGIAVDSTGAAYMTGYTESTDFPGASNDRFWDAFVVKLSPDGTALAYSTYLGGNSDSSGHGLAVDSAGYAYVAGSTSSTDFPVSASAYQRLPAGGSDVFIAKLTPDGELTYSTYLGGSAQDYLNGGHSLAIGPDGSAYVTGYTYSTDYPTTEGAFRRSNLISGEVYQRLRVQNQLGRWCLDLLDLSRRWRS